MHPPLVNVLRTPLQIDKHLSLAFEEAFRVGEMPVCESAPKWYPIHTCIKLLIRLAIDPQ
jgi:hypothetical protein